MMMPYDVQRVDMSWLIADQPLEAMWATRQVLPPPLPLTVAQRSKAGSTALLSQAHTSACRSCSGGQATKVRPAAGGGEQPALPCPGCLPCPRCLPCPAPGAHCSVGQGRADTTQVGSCTSSQAPAPPHQLLHHTVVRRGLGAGCAVAEGLSATLSEPCELPAGALGPALLLVRPNQDKLGIQEVPLQAAGRAFCICMKQGARTIR